MEKEGIKPQARLTRGLPLHLPSPKLVRIIDSSASSPIPVVNGLTGYCSGCDSALASFEAPATILFLSHATPLDTNPAERAQIISPRHAGTQIAQANECFSGGARLRR